MPINEVISFFGLHDDDIFLEIYLNKPEKINKPKEKIKKKFPEYYVYSWADMNKSFFGALKVERNVMFIILTLIILVAAFNILSSLIILVRSKTREIAILRSRI